MNNLNLFSLFRNLKAIKKTTFFEKNIKLYLFNNQHEQQQQSFVVSINQYSIIIYKKLHLKITKSTKFFTLFPSLSKQLLCDILFLSLT